MGTKKSSNAENTALLYRISKAMAAVKDGRELLKIIIAETQAVFGFYDIGLSVIDKSGLFYVDWAVLYKEISPSEANFAMTGINIEKFSVDEPLYKYAVALAEAENKPFIIDATPEFFERFKDFPHFPIEIEYGYKQYLVTTLKFGGKILGVLNFNSQKENHFNECDFDLFQAIADLVAVAVANILANEEILEQTREKETFLKIAEQSAQVRDFEELFALMMGLIHPLLKFDDFVITTLAKDKLTHQVIISQSEIENNPRIEHPTAIENMHRNLVIAEDPWFSGERVLERTAPTYYTVAGMLENYPDYFWAKMMWETGLRATIVVTLQHRGETIGGLFVHYNAELENAERFFPLIESAANQIATVIANLLANEEILEREREKTILLSISEDIASARNAVELMQVIREKAQQLIPFTDTGILIVEDDGEHHYDLAVTLVGWDDSKANRKLQNLSFYRMKHSDSYVEFVMRLIEMENSPIIEDYEQRFQEFDHPFFTIMEEIGYKEAIVAALKSGGKTFGTLWLNSLEKNQFKPDQFEVFQSLADQVAVAVSNILANEEIKKQLVEITELKKRLEEENIYLVEEVSKNYNFAEIIGTSPRLKGVFEVIETVAPTDATVLIQGETGTGKELIARAVHNRSNRNARPLIKINCATLPKELIESELFGHERGAFTGATEKRLGKFELAHNGTIFLDEIGELPLEMQVKLLQVLQEKEIERLGGKGVIKLDLRVVAATNRNLAQEVQAGRFRADLYYRLCTVELFMPPLRERKEDIEPLTMYFAQKYAAKFSRRIERISSKMLAELNAYDFPGNIRELEHIVEHAVIFSKNEKLILPRPLLINSTETTSSNNIEPITKRESQTLETIERNHILQILRQTSGRIKGKNGVAEILGLNPATVYFRMKKLGIDVKELK